MESQFAKWYLYDENRINESGEKSVSLNSDTSNFQYAKYLVFRKGQNYRKVSFDINGRGSIESDRWQLTITAYANKKQTFSYDSKINRKDDFYVRGCVDVYSKPNFEYINDVCYVKLPISNVACAIEYEEFKNRLSLSVDNAQWFVYNFDTHPIDHLFCRFAINRSQNLKITVTEDTCILFPI